MFQFFIIDSTSHYVVIFQLILYLFTGLRPCFTKPDLFDDSEYSDSITLSVIDNCQTTLYLIVKYLPIFHAYRMNFGNTYLLAFKLVSLTDLRNIVFNVFDPRASFGLIVCFKIIYVNESQFRSTVGNKRYESRLYATNHRNNKPKSVDNRSVTVYPSIMIYYIDKSRDCQRLLCPNHELCDHK